MIHAEYVFCARHCFKRTPVKLASTIALGVAVSASIVCAQQKTWALKPFTLRHYVAHEPPHARLSEILAEHEGSANWREVVVDGDRLNSVYLPAATGTKTARVFHSGTPERRALTQRRRACSGIHVQRAGILWAATVLPLAETLRKVTTHET
ncbi:MAG: hypothetical protein ABI165_16225 [Bryobacteraceae bacterium]